MFDFTINDSKSPLPDGGYLAKWVGTEIAPAKEHGGKLLEEGIRWQFEIATGPHAGRKVGRITQKQPTLANACGKMVGSLLGKPLTPNESVNLQGCVGKSYFVIVKGGKIDGISPPPQQ